MNAWIGKSILSIAIVHTVFGLVVFRTTSLELLNDGLFNTVNGQPERESVFWFLASGLFWFLMGWLVHRMEQLGLGFPRFFGQVFLAIAVLCIFVMPISGFWLLLAPAAGLVMRGMSQNRGLVEKNL